MVLAPTKLGIVGGVRRRNDSADSCEYGKGFEGELHIDEKRADRDTGRYPAKRVTVKGLEGESEPVETRSSKKSRERLTKYGDAMCCALIYGVPTAIRKALIVAGDDLHTVDKARPELN